MANVDKTTGVKYKNQWTLDQPLNQMPIKISFAVMMNMMRLMMGMALIS